MNISLFCEFTVIGRAICSSVFGVNLNFVAAAESNATAYLVGLSSSRLRPAGGNVKCQKWDYGWLVLKPNGSVVAFKFPHNNLPDIYRYEVPFDFSFDIVDISASGKYVVGIKSDGSLVEWYAAVLPSGVLPPAPSLPSGTLSSAVLVDDTKLTSVGFEAFPPISPGDLHGIDPTEAAILSASRNLVIDPVGSYPYISGESVIITEHMEGSRDVTVSRFSYKKAHAAGVRWVVNGAPPAAPVQSTPSPNHALANIPLNRVNGSFLPAGNDFVQVCVAQAQGGGDGPVFGLAVRQNGTVAQWGWFDGSLKGLPSEHSQWGIWDDGETKISGLTGVNKVEVSAYSAYIGGDGSYYSCNAAALLEDGMVVTWSPSYPLGWYDPLQAPVPRRIGWHPRWQPWNVALWAFSGLSGLDQYTPDSTQPFKVGGVFCEAQTGKYYIRFRSYATELHEAFALTLTELSDINKWADLLPEYNATQGMVSRVAGVAGSIGYRSSFFVSPANVHVEDLASFSGGYETWSRVSGGSGGGYSYKENFLRMLGSAASVVHSLGGGGLNYVGSLMAPEKNWLWAVNDMGVGSFSVDRIMERPEFLHGIEKAFVSRKLGNVDHMYVKKDGALLSFELDAFGKYPDATLASFPTGSGSQMAQRIIPHELRITIWPDDSKSNEFTKAYDGLPFANLDYGRINPAAISSYISSESLHNYGRVSGLDIVKVVLTGWRSSGLAGLYPELLPAPILEIYELTYTSYDKSYLLYPSTGTLTVNYGIPEITRHNGNGCVQSGDYWFSPGNAGDCRPSNRGFKVTAGEMLDVPIFFNRTTNRPVSTVSANNLPAWASLSVYERDKVKGILNFGETIDGSQVNYYQVSPLVRLSGIPNNVGFPQVIPFRLTASNSSGSSEASELTIFVTNVVEIDAQIITSGFFSGAFRCLKNLNVNLKCEASIGSGASGALAQDLIRGADTLAEPAIVSSGQLDVNPRGSWDFYGRVAPNFSGAGNFVGLLRLLALKRFFCGEMDIPANFSGKMLVFFYTTLNGSVTPRPLLRIGISFFENEAAREEYREEFIAPRQFDYVFDGERAIIEDSVLIPSSRYGIYNIWTTDNLPAGDVRAHISLSLL